MKRSYKFCESTKESTEYFPVRMLKMTCGGVSMPTCCPLSLSSLLGIDPGSLVNDGGGPAIAVVAVVSCSCNHFGPHAEGEGGTCRVQPPSFERWIILMVQIASQSENRDKTKQDSHQYYAEVVNDCEDNFQLCRGWMMGQVLCSCDHQRIDTKSFHWLWKMKQGRKIEMDDNLTNEALLFALELAQFHRNHRRVVWKHQKYLRNPEQRATRR